MILPNIDHGEYRKSIANIKLKELASMGSIKSIPSLLKKGGRQFNNNM